MKNLIIIIFVLFLSGLSLGAPLNNKFISQEARWIIHLDYEAFNKTQLSQCIKEEIKTQGLESKIEEFKNVFSFNPLEDIKNITLYGKNKNEETFLMIIQGKWEPAKVLILINKNLKYKESSYKNLTLYQWEDSNNGQMEPRFGCFFDKEIILISGNIETLKNGLDVLNGESKSSNNKLLLKKSVKGAFITASAENINDDPIIKDKEKELFSLVIGEIRGKFYIRGTITAKTIEEASVVNQAIVGAIAMFQLGAEEKQPKLSALSKEIEVILKNRAVSVSFEKESVELIKILKEAGEIQKQIEKTQGM